MSPSCELEHLKNLGPVSAAWLREIGIHTREQLEEVGPIEAYQRLKLSGRSVNAVFVYAVQGALWDMHWNALPPGVKEDLKRRCRQPHTSEAKA